MLKLSDGEELLGIYFSIHLLKLYPVPLRYHGYVYLSSAQKMSDRQPVTSAVIVQSIRKIRTKRGDPMAFMLVGDESEDLETVIFPELYRAEHRWLEEEMLIIIQGKIEIRNGRPQMLLHKIKPFDETLLIKSEQRLFIKLTEADSEKELAKIKEIAARYKRSEERRVGKECRYGWWPYKKKKNKKRRDTRRRVGEQKKEKDR